MRNIKLVSARNEVTFTGGTSRSIFSIKVHCMEAGRESARLNLEHQFFYGFLIRNHHFFGWRKYIPLIFAPFDFSISIFYIFQPLLTLLLV